MNGGYGQNVGKPFSSATTQVNVSTTLSGTNQLALGATNVSNNNFRILDLYGSTEFTNTNSTTDAPGLSIRGNSTLNNFGTFQSKATANNYISLYSADAATNNAFINSGSFSQESGHTTTISPQFTNTGTVTVNAGSENILAFNGHHDYIQNLPSSGPAPLTTVDGKLSVNADKNVNINAGTLKGVGEVVGNVVNANPATVAPGDSIGTLKITGGYTQSGKLDVEVGASSHDWLNVIGSATINPGATLSVTFDAGVTAGSYSILSSTGLTGTFASGDIHPTYLGTGITLAGVSYEGNQVTLNVAAVPEPESYAMILAGLGLMTLVMRRRKL